MKRFFCLLIFVSSIFTARAQFALIPDTNFRNFLMNNGFAACITGNSLDTTCTAVVTATKINCTGSGIHSLTGIEYFDNLDTLICSNNYYIPSIPRLSDSVSYINCSNCSRLTSLNSLPASLLYMNCYYDSLTSLPQLPSNLKTLLCDHNFLASLSALPPSLLVLSCSYNILTALPSIPAGLSQLICATNNIGTLPALPNGLDTLNCAYNYHIVLPPAFPDSLKYLGCYADSLTSLPNLPSNLVVLSCSNNLLTSLPSLPASLINIYCTNNLLTSLPSLPQHLNSLYCSYNNLLSLPAFPDPYYFTHLECQNNNLNAAATYTMNLSSASSMFYLNCSNNPFLGYISLSAPYPQFNYINCSNCGLLSLPNNLTFNWVGGNTLICDNNQISYIPSLSSVGYLSCAHNQLTTLPSLFIFSLSEVHCNNNFISSLPDFPPSLTVFNIDSNPIACLPELHQIGTLYWRNTNIHCLPNVGNITVAIPSMNNVPLCQPSDNCPSLWNITGQVFFDADSNCTQNGGEINLKNIPVVLDSSGVQLQEFLTDNLGRYSFRTGNGNYTIRIDTTSAPFRVICPGTFYETALLNVVDSMDTVPSFGLLCNYGFDLTARSISPVQMFRPGFQNTIYLDAGEGMSFSGINCMSAVGGSVQAILNSLVSYVSPGNGALTPSSVNGDTITWNINDFSLVNPVHDFNIIVHVSAAATINDSVCISLNILPSVGDNIPSNNSLAECFPVRGAVDPNEKFMSPGGIVDSATSWFTFTIFFQNVGNAPAENIYILDTLDQNLEAPTFTFLSSSHDVITQMLPGNILRFNFNNIQLPDSISDEPASHGYVQFKVRKKEPLPLNTIISNTANIYFDYNAPVETNTVSATLYSCPPIALNYSATDSICAGTCISFQNLSTNTIAYQWHFPGAIPDTSSAMNPSNICYAHGGYYPVTLIANCLNQFDTLTRDSFITVTPGAAFTVSEQNICPGSCIDFANQSFDATGYQWSFQGAVPASSIDLNPAGICYSTSGSYIVSLVAVNGACVDSVSFNNYITVYSPATITVNQSGDTLFSSAGFANYQWFYNGDSIPGAIDYYCVATLNGDYMVTCTDSNGCETSVGITNVMTTIQSEDIDQIKIYPVPATTQLTVVAHGQMIKAIRFYNFLGSEAMDVKIVTISQKGANLNIGELVPGIYFLRIETEKGFVVKRFVKSTCR